MGSADNMDQLVLEEIGRAVADAVAGGVMISTGPLRARILEACPGCGLSKRQLDDLIIGSAAKAGVAVAFSGHQAWTNVSPV